MLGLRFCARAFSSCGEWGPLFIAVRGLLTIAASLVAEQRLQTLRLSSCGSRAQLLRGMWDLPRPGLEPMSPALAGRFSTSAPPGKPPVFISIPLGGGSQKILLWFMSKSVLMFSSKSFSVFSLTFRSLIHFEFIFVCGVKECSYFILLHVAVQFAQHHLLKRLSFLHCISSPPLS